MDENGEDAKDPRRAAVLEINPDGSGMRVFAGGLRNPVGLRFQPGTDTLWTVVNERDRLGDDLVPDLLTSVRDGAFYGWPYTYFGKNVDPRKAGERPDLVAKSISPDYALGPHVAPLGFDVLHRHVLPGRVPRRGVRWAARIVEPVAVQRLQGRLHSVPEQPAERRSAGLPDRVRRQSGGLDGLRQAGRRHRHARRLAAGCR